MKKVKGKSKDNEYKLRLFAFVYVWIILGALAAAVPIFFVVLLSRHKKAAMGSLELIGSEGRAETTLQPDGAVLVRGELWRARSATGVAIERDSLIRVRGARGHLLIIESVEPEKRKLSDGSA